MRNKQAKSNQPQINQIKNRRIRKEVIWMTLSVLIAVTCMLLPGTIVSIKASNNKNIIHQVYSSNYFGASGSVAVMTLYERMKLISGEWDSTSQVVDQQEMKHISEIPEEAFHNVVSGQTGDVQLAGYCYMDYQSVLETAEEGLQVFYDSGIYPEDPVSQYSNWYRPTITLYQYSDAVFDSYTCYVWLVELDYYDGSMQHVMLIDDTTGLVLAGGIKGEDYRLPISWRENMEEEESLPYDIVTYYRQRQHIREPIADITGVDCYQPQYALWSEAYGLTEEQLTGAQSGMIRKQYLFSENNDIRTYEAAEEEVRNIVANEKFIYSLQWDEEQCWFYLVPFTVPLEAEASE